MTENNKIEVASELLDELWINYGPTLLSAVDIAKVEKAYHAKLVCELDILDKNGHWMNIPAQIYYCEKPPNDYSNYFAIYVSNRKVMITSAEYVVGLPINGIALLRTGEVLYSRYRHDYRKAQTANVYVDGGQDYVRTVGDVFDVKNVVLTIVNGKLQVVKAPDAATKLQDDWDAMIATKRQITAPPLLLDEKNVNSSKQLYEQIKALSGIPPDVLPKASKTKFIYKNESIPQSVFVVTNADDWRTIETVFENMEFDGTVYIPEIKTHTEGPDSKRWYEAALHAAQVILLWVPKNTKVLPVIVTTPFFQQALKEKRVVIGCPKDAVRINYMTMLSEDCRIPLYNSIDGTVVAAVDLAEWWSKK